MRRTFRYANHIAAMLLLASGGAGLGMAWSSLTSSAVKWERPARFSELTPVAEQAIDQFAAGRSWAQAAYDGGLRRCPEMNADFIAGCQAEMKALAARPDFAPGSYGGPLLVTTYEPPVAKVPMEQDAVAEVEPEFPAEETAPALVPAAYETTPENYPAAEVLPQ